DWVSGEGCWVVVEMEPEVREKWCYSLAGNHGEQVGGLRRRHEKRVRASSIYVGGMRRSDEESLPDEDVPAEEFKIYSNPLCDEVENNSDKLDPHCFNVESDFVESLLNRDTFIDFSSKFDFSGELAHIKPEIPKSDFDFEEEIRLIENLLYDNSFP
nr:hypothetical protein [Tanacetum cinerariifolium]